MPNINYTFNPKNIENDLSSELELIYQLVDSKISKIEEINFYHIDTVDIVFEKNSHEGKNTFACKLILQPVNKFQKTYVKSMEGHNYLAITREILNEAIDFVLGEKE